MKPILIALGFCLALAAPAEASHPPPNGERVCRAYMHGLSVMNDRGALFVKCWNKRIAVRAMDRSRSRSSLRHGSPQGVGTRCEACGRAHRRAYVRRGPARNNARAACSAACSFGEVVSHPAGCPRIAFCGCGAAVEVFGRPIRALWLAREWFRFPRAEPSAGMAAVRAHHVMIIREYLGGGLARVYDANSGRHLTRVHVRSIAGYRIVNPRAMAL
jgi:hypothetical protein